MDLTVLIPAIFGGVFGLLVLAFILKLLLQSLWVDPFKWVDSYKLRKKAECLEEFDAKFSNEPNPSEELLSSLKNAFFLDRVSGDKALAMVRSHNVACFARILTISENYEGQIRNLATAEELLQARTELLELYIKTRSIQSRVKQRAEEKERAIPSWSENEFQKKLESIEDQLDTNRRALENQLGEIFNALKDIRSNSNVIYH